MDNNNTMHYDGWPQYNLINCLIVKIFTDLFQFNLLLFLLCFTFKYILLLHGHVLVVH